MAPRRTALLVLALLAQPAILGAEPELREYWAGIHLEGRRAGSAFYRVDHDPVEGGYRVTSRLRLKVRMMGEVREMNQSTEVEVDNSFRLRRFQFSFKSAGSEFSGEGAMVAPGRLEFSLRTGSGMSSRELSVPPEVLIDETVEVFLGLHFDRIDSKEIFPTFDPVTGRVDSVIVERLEPEDIVVAGKREKSHPFQLTALSGQSMVWFSESGDFLKAAGPLGLSMTVEPKDSALSRIEDGELVDFLQAFAVAVDRRIPDPRAVTRLRIRLEGLESTDWIPIGARQKWVDESEGELEILAGGVDVDLADEAGDLDRFLEPEPFIQSSDPRIKDQAELITAGVHGRLRKVERVVEWVHHNLFREPTASLPSALDVLQSRRGDCNEHTVLTVALLRSLGIPSREAVGLVYDSGFFYYHAWPEVHIDGWRGIEPTFGRLWADATHIKLAQGGLRDQFNLLRAMNRLKLRIVYSE